MPFKNGMASLKQYNSTTNLAMNGNFKSNYYQPKNVRNDFAENDRKYSDSGMNDEIIVHDVKPKSPPMYRLPYQQNRATISPPRPLQPEHALPP